MTTVEQTAIKCLAGKSSGVFVDKSGNMHQLHSVEDCMWVFLDVKTDAITYVKELESFVKEFIPTPQGMEFKAFLSKIRHSVPKSWKEYRAKVPENKLYKFRGVVEGKELAETFIAMMQLMSLRQAWIGDWDSNRLGYAIMLDVERDIFVSHDLYHRPLTFPERKLALEFRDCFKDLLEQAKPLL